MRLGVDCSGFDLDAPLPELPPSNASRSGRDNLLALARRDNLTVRQLARICGTYDGFTIIGAPEEMRTRCRSGSRRGRRTASM